MTIKEYIVALILIITIAALTVFKTPTANFPGWAIDDHIGFIRGMVANIEPTVTDRGEKKTVIYFLDGRIKVFNGHDVKNMKAGKRNNIQYSPDMYIVTAEAKSRWWQAP